MMSRLSDSMRSNAGRCRARDGAAGPGAARNRPDDDRQAEQHRQELAGDGRPGDAGNAPAELQAEQDAEQRC